MGQKKTACADTPRWEGAWYDDVIEQRAIGIMVRWERWGGTDNRGWRDFIQDCDLNPSACQMSGALPGGNICMLNSHVKSIHVVTACRARSLKNRSQSFRQDSGFLNLMDIREEENGTDLIQGKQNLKRQRSFWMRERETKVTLHVHDVQHE